MQIGEYTLANADKVTRVIEGTTNAQGELIPGVEPERDEKTGEITNGAAILAEYDKIGGLIYGKDGAKVKTGAFWDFKNKAPRAKADVVYEFRINGEVVEMRDGEPEPLEIKAAKLVEMVAKKKATKTK